MSSSSSALEWAWQRVKPLGMFLSGAIFGLGWFCAADALCRSAFVLHESVSPTLALPGVAASLALLIITAVRRSDVAGGASGYFDGDADGVAARARCALFLGYALSFGAVSAAVVGLCVAKQRDAPDLWMQAAVVLQTALIALAGMLAFVARDGDDGDEFGYGGF